MPVKVGGKLGKAARELANLALHQRDQNQEQRQYQQQNDKDHEQSAHRARHTMAFRPRHERAAEIREDRADQKRRQNRPEEMQQRRDNDRGGDEPQVVHGPQTPRRTRGVGGRQLGRHIEVEIRAWRGHFR